MPEKFPSVEIRNQLVEALRLDLIGPDNGHACAHELLSDLPSRWYLTGYLVPANADEKHRTIAEEAQEDIDSGVDNAKGEDSAAPEQPASGTRYLPSSTGLSFLVPETADQLKVEVMWGDYFLEELQPEGDEAPLVSEENAVEERKGAYTAAMKKRYGFRRDPRSETVVVTLPKHGGAGPMQTIEVPNSRHLEVFAVVRSGDSFGNDAKIAKGTRAVSLFVVNKRPVTEKPDAEKVFQVTLRITCDAGFVARPDLRDGGDEQDERVADLQYRDDAEYAVGHGIAVDAIKSADGTVHELLTNWMPTGHVPRVAPESIAGVECGMEALAALGNAEEAATKLSPLVSQYRAWGEAQKQKVADLDASRRETAEDLMANAAFAADRIANGIAALGDPKVFTAFTLANKVMAAAARRRSAAQENRKPEEVATPAWRPFQLAFILLCLKGIADPKHGDRDRVDLLFFPTGGGKTEAYLGLAAFTLAYRRLTHAGDSGMGLSVLMRYTLRLLTLDQLGRAAALMCALELERLKRPELGKRPFEIGLWVGSAATPNRLGHKGYKGPGQDETAHIKLFRYKNGRGQPPIPLENCPWCGTAFTADSFRMEPNETKPENLAVRCRNACCEFSGERPLPILTVDEPIYRRLPCFIIATVDKFAALPWVGATGKLFGKVERQDDKGFYAKYENQGAPIQGGELPPPDLIIQDELHLISGPLGTIAGIYETTIDALCTRTVDGHTVRPKIIASTATVRRANRQIRALFGRRDSRIFPPQGPDRTDTFFSKTHAPEISPERLYLGVAAQGRSLKVVLLRTALALLATVQTEYEKCGGKTQKENPADPYMTLLGYFNSLRELGGSRRIIEDEVRTRLGDYGRRVRHEPVAYRPFSRRNFGGDVLELTSRVSTSDVSKTKHALSTPFPGDKDNKPVDVALATNMISVGLDITRLGLLVALGQPKTSAEYIQATSRVGRDHRRPGLVVTLLNIHKPRDRSHYERFGFFHKTFYRSVEATSVTPFAPRALDRALASAYVALCRHSRPELSGPDGAHQVSKYKDDLRSLAKVFAERAMNHREWETDAEREAFGDHVLNLCKSLLDDWDKIRSEAAADNSTLHYQVEVAGQTVRRLLQDSLTENALTREQDHFRSNRSMRDVEASVEIHLETLGKKKTAK